MIQSMNVNTILSMDPIKLVAWLDETYIKPLPAPKSSAEFASHNHLLGELANTFAFMTSVHAVAKIMVREAKKNNKSKDEVNDCIDRRDVLEAFMNTIKMQYNAFSRMITVQKQADDELRMMNSKV